MRVAVCDVAPADDDGCPCGKADEVTPPPPLHAVIPDAADAASAIRRLRMLNTHRLPACPREIATNELFIKKIAGLDFHATEFT